MRFYIVGAGAIGTLLSFHLKRTSRRLLEDPQAVLSLPHASSIPYLPSPFQLGVILRLRKSGVAKRVQTKLQNSVFVQRDDAKERESGFGVEYQTSMDQMGGVFKNLLPPSTSDEPLPGSSRLEELGYPKGSIDSVIVTTKAQSTLVALRPLLPYITSATTIVLLQNGQGVLDLLLERFFTDPATRPNFILASTTHGAWSMNKLHCVHAAFGKIDLGVVPNRNLGKGYERLMIPNPIDANQNRPEEESSRSAEEEEDEEERREGNRSEAVSYDRFLPRNRRISSQGRKEDLQLPPILNINAIPNSPHTQTLKHTLSMLLNLPLAVTWQPIRNFQMLSLKKLVVNACINPVTALVECRNGDLFGNSYASSTIRELCTEISLILEALAQKSHIREAERLRHEQANQGGETTSLEQEAVDWEAMNKSDYLLTPSNNILGKGSVLDPSLRAGALIREVQRVAQLTGPNYSSMLQDIRSNAPSTEIDHINGYFSRLGKSLGIATPINDLMVNLIKLKTTRTSASWKSKM